MTVLKILAFSVLTLTAHAAATIEINFALPATPAPLRVNNRDTVTIKVTGVNPFNECAKDLTREAIEPGGSPISALLDLVKSLGGSIIPPDNVPTFLNSLKVPSADAYVRASELVNTALARQADVDGQIRTKDAYFRILGHMVTALKQTKEQAKFTAWHPDVKNALEAATVPKTSAIPSGGALSPGCESGVFDSCRSDLAGLGREAAGSTLPSLVSAEVLVDVATEYFKENQAKMNASERAEIAAKIDQISGLQAALVAAVESLETKAATLARLLGIVAPLQDSFVQEFKLVLDRNAKISGTISCSDRLTKVVTMDKVPIEIYYQDLPRLSWSGGMLISTVARHSFSVDQQAGVATNYKIVDSSSPVQAIPMSMIHARVLGWRPKPFDVTLNAAGGLGVNANGGSTEVEYNAGVSVGLGNVYLTPGWHFGRPSVLGGGFKVGDSLSNSITLPVNRRWDNGFSFAVQYRIRLP